MFIRNVIAYLSILFIIISCKNNITEDKPSTLFSLVPRSQTNIDFRNTVKQNFNFNFLIYQYVYNGAGVAVGDINNDGLQDIYFSSNQNSNKLYINKGDFQFEDITNKAGVADESGWSTGVNMIDINSDGLLDIYVCKSGSLKQPELRRNKLYINQGDNTFKEEAQKWGLNQVGYSTQSYFFDYDKDGDLDMYLVNHRPDFQNSRRIENEADIRLDVESSDHLFKNEGTHFTDVTLTAGVQNRTWGLSASVGDFDNDGWLDIYVANDYIQPDKLYINNKDGTFSDQILDRFKHISYNSMGSDYADINNDLLPDLMVLDMSAEDHSRSKENMATMNTKGFWAMVDSGYHHSYMANMLHLNNGNGTFNEIGQLSGISKTDWSWAPLVADFDNDGYKDVFVSNGIERDLTNQDYRRKLNGIIRQREDMSIDAVEKMMPSNKVSNYVFRNKGDLTFEKKMSDWGLNQEVNSNGVAYADFDNDGDLDLVLNNQADQAMLYRNNSEKNFISIKLKGGAKNPFAIGATAYVYTSGNQQVQDNFTVRGYQSSMANVLNFGLGEENLVDSIRIDWGDNTSSMVKHIEINQTITLAKSDAEIHERVKTNKKANFQSIEPKTLGISFVHKENKINDFAFQTLLPQKQSNLGPGLAVGDVNGDGLDDFYIGGAKDQPGVLFIQNQEGHFDNSNTFLFDKDKQYADQGALLFDIENDGDLDLYVTSGGYELTEDSPMLQDRLYVNDGNGNFKKSLGLPAMFTSTKTAVSIDFDRDGDNDLIVGGRLVPKKYPLSPRSYILRNDEGTFTDVTDQVAPGLKQVGLVNDISITDFDNDGDNDFIIAGEWMPITLFEYKDAKFEVVNNEALSSSSGWWNTIKVVDINNDGFDDYILGNLGDNNKFHPSIESPLHVYGTYFDQNETFDMVLSKLYKGELVPVRGKECSSQQNPYLKQKIHTYKAFANSTLKDIYGEDNLEKAYHRQTNMLSTALLMNNGKGEFTMKNLPNAAQMGPTMAVEVLDINDDGHSDIIGIGAIYQAEVETIRYDGNTGYILLGDSKGNFQPMTDSSFCLEGDSRDIAAINIQDQIYYLAANNDGPLKLLKLN